MGRPSHPKKDIEGALKYAEKWGWRVEVRRGHAWARLYCPHNDDECRCGEFCVISVWTTPKSPINHARAILRVVDNCVNTKTVIDK